MVMADGPDAILVAVDASENSYRAAAYAAGLARRQGARLICLYVHAVGGMTSLSPVLVGPLVEAQAETVDEIRRAIADNAEPRGINVTLVEATGNPAQEIARVADEMRVDAVVVGASSQAGHKIIGSIGAALVRKAHWPIIVVP
jgi:nucleotide-binding universal stress UspA family protein